MRGIRRHLDYISRNGKLELENEDGQKFNGAKEVQSIANDWKRAGIEEISKYREALNIAMAFG